MNEILWPTIDSKHLIVDSKQMLTLENEMFSDGMPQEALMEKAGIQISRWLLKKKPLLNNGITVFIGPCLLYTSPSPRDFQVSRMPSSA